MSQTCKDVCKIVLNNDIMGVGVRAALYAQIIIAWLVSLWWPNTFIKNSRTAYMTATAILVSTLIQWKKGGISVLDALVVSLMTSMMIIFIVVSGTSREEAKPTNNRSNTTGNPDADPTQTSPPPSSATPPENTRPTGPLITMPQPIHVAPPIVQQRTTAQEAAAHASDPDTPKLQPRFSYTQRFIRCCFVNIWGAWCFILWKDPVHFGLEGDKANCTTNNDVVIWVFGEDVKAVSPGIRVAALVLISILYFVANCSLFFTLENVLEPAMRMFSFLGSLITVPSKNTNTTPPTVTTKSLHENPVINRVHQLLHLFAFGTLLYLLISIEMTIHRNTETRDWSYGQVIALILLLPQLNDVCSTHIEAREERQNKKEQEKRDNPSTTDATQRNSIPMTDLKTRTPSPAPPV